MGAKNKNIVAIIQARMGSTRLPGKVLMDIEGKPMLFYVLQRLKRSKLINRIVIATTINPKDDIIEEFCNEYAVACYRGSEDDVLDRYYQTAKLYKADIIIRITSDCPLIDPQIVDATIRLHIKDGNDYTSNSLEKTFPRGFDTEALEFDALKKAKEQALESCDKEHVTMYFYKNPHLFKLGCYKATGELNRPKLRLTVDTIEDFTLIKNVFSKLYVKNKEFNAHEIINLFKNEPQLADINKFIIQKT